tara:strand:+ start:424 stop:1167 length:744 start_codon:yes stop_codon:yes gene_type:complete
MGPSVDIVIPVLNEENSLPGCVMELSGFLEEKLPNNPWRIVIADNGSTDNTSSVSDLLISKYPGVSYLHLPQKGRGRALRNAWMESNADLVGYMDVDLSTRLTALPLLIGSIEEGCDIAIGSRLRRGSKTKRTLKREIVSRSYNLLVKSLFWVPFADAQCGFKVMTKHAAKMIVPLVENNHWFFDTELLLIAAKNGFKICEMPVEWVEDKDSRVKILQTACEDLKGLLRLRFGGIPSVPIHKTSSLE